MVEIKTLTNPTVPLSYPNNREISVHPFGLRGSVVPWSAANNKFMCPYHGSQYTPTGAVVRGPAPLPLTLAHCDTNETVKILFSP